MPDLSPVAVAGTPEECATGIQADVDAGAGLVVLDPMDGDPAGLERLAAEVIPGVR